MVVVVFPFFPKYMVCALLSLVFLSVLCDILFFFLFGVVFLAFYSAFSFLVEVDSNPGHNLPTYSPNI